MTKYFIVPGEDIGFVADDNGYYTRVLLFKKYIGNVHISLLSDYNTFRGAKISISKRSHGKLKEVNDVLFWTIF